MDSIKESFRLIFDDISFNNRTSKPNESCQTVKHDDFLDFLDLISFSAKKCAFYVPRVLQCFISKKICLEEYKKIFSVLTSFNLPNDFFGVEFYFEKNIIFSIKFHESKMKILEIFLETLFQISKIFLNILTFAIDLHIKSIKIKTEKDISIYDYHQDFKEIFGIFDDFSWTNYSLWIEKDFSFKNNTVLLNFEKCAKYGFSSFLIDLIGRNHFRIEFLENTIIANEMEQLCEYLDFFIKSQVVTNSKLDLLCWNLIFKISLPKDNVSKEFQEIFKKMNAFSKNKIQSILKMFFVWLIVIFFFQVPKFLWRIL